MPLRDFFSGSPECAEHHIKIVLDDGLSAAETSDEPRFNSGIEYRNLLQKRQVEPLFLNEVDEPFRKIFRKWRDERSDRINKVLERAANPEREYE
ncbi:hypothetical protein HZA39_01115 [Candidatus Peregrinibacteria bacterium]|nr:hypothetical protein [Candidatus Peregrinibacteria bacterium]